MWAAHRDFFELIFRGPFELGLLGKLIDDLGGWLCPINLFGNAFIADSTFLFEEEL